MKTTRVIGGLMLIGAAMAFNTGCTARAGVAGYARTGPPIYYSEPPTLLYIGPEIWVVRDAEYPVYYSDGYYWAYYDDGWYRSDRYDGAWVNVNLYTVPTRIVHRDHHAYVHYRGRGEPTRIAPRGPAMRPAALEQRYQKRSLPPGQQRRMGPPVVPPGQQRSLPPGQQRRIEQERSIEHERRGGPRAEERGRPPPQQQQQRKRGRGQSDERREKEHGRGGR